MQGSELNLVRHTIPKQMAKPRPPPTIFRYAPDEIKCPKVQLELQDRDEAIKQLKFHYARAQSRMKSVADKYRRNVEFEVGDWVFLKLRPHRQQTVIRRINQKFAARLYGPFLISARIGVVAYCLKLLESARIHPVFHVSLLKQAVGNASVEPALPPGLMGDPTDQLEDKLDFQAVGIDRENAIDKEDTTESSPSAQVSGPKGWIVYQRRSKPRG
ncbi:hypothetical protein LXL04_020788 [Taraxacum kok-saghyz]